MINISTSMFKITSLNSGLVKRMNYCCNRISYIICNSIWMSVKTQKFPACVRPYKSNNFKFVNKSLAHVNYLNRSFSSFYIEQSYVSLLRELETRLRSQSLCSHDDWEHLHKIYSGNKRDSVFAVKVLSFCIEKKWFALGKSLIDYLDSCNINLTLAVLGRYVRLCGECSDEVEEEYIFNLINKIKEITPVLDSQSTADVIVALAMTSRWKECFQLMNPNKIFSDPTPQMYSAVITAAFKNSEFSLAWNLLEKLLLTSKLPTTNTCIKWINIFEEEKKIEKRYAEEHMSMLMDYFGKFNVHLPQSCTDKIKKFLSDDKWRGEYVFIPASGECCHCKTTLELNFLTEPECELLRDIFLKKVLIGKDTFLNTTPNELKKFKTFIENTAPFDYVLDGFSIACGKELKNKTIAGRGELLCHVVHELVVNQKKNVLIVGRHHILQWEPKYLNFLKKMAHLFTTAGVSQDDPFILYAAMYSGFSTKFVSRDPFPDYKNILKSYGASTLYRKWKTLHHVQMTVSDGTFILSEPIIHETSLQRTENSIHIPCSQRENLVISFNPPDKWLCLTKIYDDNEQNINIQEILN